MPAKTTDIADEELEPVADETANSARRVVAAYATDADECRMLLAMLGFAPGENALSGDAATGWNRDRPHP